MIAKLIQRYKAWRERKHWERQHMDFIRVMILQDARWLSVHPVAKEITERYEKAISKDWYKIHHEEISKFRDRIQLISRLEYHDEVKK